MLYDPKWNTSPIVPIEHAWQKILLNAIGVIEEGGWCQHFARIGTARCIMGALSDACMKDARFFRNTVDDAMKSFHDAMNAIEDTIGVGWVSIPEWNDAPERTKEEVLAVMRKATEVNIPIKVLV